MINSSVQTKSEVNFDPRNEFGNLKSNLFFLQKVKFTETHQSKTLEIGSGHGSLLNYFVQRKYDIQGVEKNPLCIEKSRQLYKDLPLKRVEGAILPFEDHYFDFVISFDVFEHIPDSDLHLQEISRVLKPGGCYLLQTPNKITNVIFETIRWKSFTEWQKDHCSLHNYWEMLSRLEKNGFEQIEFFDIPVVNEFFICKVQKYLGKNLGVILLNSINPDRLPMFLRTNFYIKAKTKG